MWWPFKKKKTKQTDSIHMMAHVTVGVEGEASFYMRNKDSSVWLIIDDDGDVATIFYDSNKMTQPTAEEIDIASIPDRIPQWRRFLKLKDAEDIAEMEEQHRREAKEWKENERKEQSNGN